MNQDIVRQLVEEALAENEKLFLIELSFLADNKIYVEVDGDTGINLKECIRISRNVEHNLDREEEDFSLEVTSPDISKPLKVLRQYTKNIGRTLQVSTLEGEKFEGILTLANDNHITLEWKAREPKPIGKGKVTVQKTVEIAYKNIREAKVKIIFN
ncbi:ribosome assembly cofactor RimP [Urechidicola croceus]|uniref:Ribosome maturation factor RimP n=1 Tax=Urechidicola croceus TaxID=1850246 RepID=A0A1D8PA97_9FLAO|nr:ribosome assembly cofactor RimP [Urechidicola croceus]AOW21483.1 ribosome assembly cofactor RimP [Urechidicola croceus]